MANNDLSCSVCNELELLSSDVTKQGFNSLVSKFKVVAEHIKSGEITSDDYAIAETEFSRITSCDDSVSGLTNFGMFMLFLLDNVDSELKVRSIRKTKGSYSVPEKVIDGVISNIVFGERVTDACAFAGISTVTLYNRIRDRGYNDIKEFFKEQRRKLKEEN